MARKATTPRLKVAMPRVLLFCLILVPGLSVPARCHELPDGQIERRVQISVKPDCVLVEYSLGMNEATLEKELSKSERKAAATLSARWKQYQKIVSRSLPGKLQLTIDGVRSPLKAFRSDSSGRGHSQLTCLLRADIALTRQLKTIVVTDASYPDTPGHYRIAMKGRSGVLLKKSSVASTVSRAKPSDLTKLNKKRKKSATRAEGVFVLSDRAGRRTE